MQVGDPFILFDGLGTECEARISSQAKKLLSAEIGICQCIDRDSPLRIHLAQALCKNDRMEFVLQKATELGVNRITPIQAQFSQYHLPKERMLKRMQHWRQVCIAACEQCGRNSIPILHEPLNFHDQVAAVSGSKWIMHPGGKQQLRTLATPENDIHILIGPEGGFHPDEFESAMRHGFVAVGLGPRILRTETAAIAVISAINALWGDA